jgi:hypothetical protein
MSPTASLHSTLVEDQLPVKQTAAEDDLTDKEKRPAPVNEYEDAERNFAAKSPKFWAIIVGIYLAIFLVALVSFLPTLSLCWV